MKAIAAPEKNAGMGAANKRLNMTRTPSKKNLIWALDPLEALREKPGKLQSHAAETLRLLSEKRQCAIEPVYVMNATPPISIETDIEWNPIYLEAAENAGQKILNEFPKLNLLPLKILTQSGTSTFGAVNTLTQYAARQQAFLIVANTHSKSGFKRFFLGSFAETLLLRSQIPVVVVGPHSHKIQTFDKILFPTDFAPHTRFVFKRVLDLARSLGSSITLLYVIPFTVQPYTSGNILFPGSYWGAYLDYVTATKKNAEKSVQSWSHFASKYGIKVNLVVDHRGYRSVWESIIHQARKNHAGMIAMESMSGPVSSAVIGSVTRQVVRHAECPIWILHPKALESIRERKAAA